MQERKIREIADVTSSVKARFVCDRCGHTAGVTAFGHQERAFVKMDTSRERDAPGSSDPAPLQLAADAHARGAKLAGEDARTNLSLARCPSCGRRSLRGSARVLLPVLLGGVGAFLAWVFVAREFFIHRAPFAKREWYPDILVAVPLVLVACVVHLMMRHRAADHANMFE
ncbi:MAG: hypothetical protein JNK04_04255 [Myxococcales bacterium]|nr:hypothetical protein [Myxococcales bacterium]